MKNSTDPYGSCRLCPRRCEVDRTAGYVGACKADSTVWIARSALHFWEEPPISGESGSGTIFFSHCPLGCVYCQNRAIAHDQVGRPVTVEELAACCLDLQGQGALNINLVTPTHYAPSIRVAIGLARQQGLRLPVVWNTSGYETVEAIRDNAVDPTVDVYLTDFKYASSMPAKAYSRAADYSDVAVAALDAMVQAVGEPEFDVFHGQERLIRGVVVRHLLLPSHLEDSKRVVRLLHERYGSRIRLSLMNQYTPVLVQSAEAGDVEAMRILKDHPELARTVTDAEYEELLDYADDLGVQDYYWQDGPTQSQSFIPEFSGQIASLDSASSEQDREACKSR